MDNHDRHPELVRPGGEVGEGVLDGVELVGRQSFGGGEVQGDGAVVVVGDLVGEALEALVAVGGHEHEVPEFLAHLPRSVRERVAGTFAGWGIPTATAISCAAMSVEPPNVTTNTLRPTAAATCSTERSPSFVESTTASSVPGMSMGSSVTSPAKPSPATALFTTPTKSERVSTTVGREGQMADRASIAGADGGWAQTVGSLNMLITDLMQPTTEVAIRRSVTIPRLSPIWMPAPWSKIL
mgnify:CR=1 FL=1